MSCRWTMHRCMSGPTVASQTEREKAILVLPRSNLQSLTIWAIPIENISSNCQIMPQNTQQTQIYSQSFSLYSSTLLKSYSQSIRPSSSSLHYFSVGALSIIGLSNSTCIWQVNFYGDWFQPNESDFLWVPLAILKWVGMFARFK